MNFTRRQRSARGSGQELRAEILTATKELLARTGSVEAVSIREVGKIVGVSAPSIYRHFSDKDQLIGAVVAQVFEDLEAVMRAAGDPADSPMERLRNQGLAYVRFAIEHPEQYRLATAPGENAGAVDQVLGSGAFTHFAAAVSDCMAAGLIEPGDPIPVVLELWASAHGVASLLIAKPYLPWGDLETVADRVLRAACVGRVVIDNVLGEDATPADVTQWVAEQRQRR
ncbi:TetR/AcrR family transcriptional regulator [Nocardia sp. GCM10030253]|uniref:TetR/AcrR family transcriptional regulator n=1 Tax=Nocardia sp. GCM10030253 TaxID=3273404 RepID=UPI003642B217